MGFRPYVPDPEPVYAPESGAFDTFGLPPGIQQTPEDALSSRTWRETAVDTGIRAARQAGGLAQAGLSIFGAPEDLAVPDPIGTSPEAIMESGVRAGVEGVSGIGIPRIARAANAAIGSGLEALGEYISPGRRRADELFSQIDAEQKAALPATEASAPVPASHGRFGPHQGEGYDPAAVARAAQRAEQESKLTFRKIGADPVGMVGDIAGNAVPFMAAGRLARGVGLAEEVMAPLFGTTIEAGSVKQNIAQTVMDAPTENLMKDPAFKAEAAAFGEAIARKRMADRAQSYLESGDLIALGALSGFLQSKAGADAALMRAGSGAVNKGLTRGVLRNTLREGAKESGTEFPGEMYTTMAGNVGAARGGADIDPFQGVMESGIMAAASAGPSGGIAGGWDAYKAARARAGGGQVPPAGEQEPPTAPIPPRGPKTDMAAQLVLEAEMAGKSGLDALLSAGMSKDRAKRELQRVRDLVGPKVAPAKAVDTAEDRKAAARRPDADNILADLRARERAGRPSPQDEISSFEDDPLANAAKRTRQGTPEEIAAYLEAAQKGIGTAEDEATIGAISDRARSEAQANLENQAYSSLLARPASVPGQDVTAARSEAQRNLEEQWAREHANQLAVAEAGGPAFYVPKLIAAAVKADSIKPLVDAGVPASPSQLRKMLERAKPGRVDENARPDSSLEREPNVERGAKPAPVPGVGIASDRGQLGEVGQEANGIAKGVNPVGRPEEARPASQALPGVDRPALIGPDAGTSVDGKAVSRLGDEGRDGGEVHGESVPPSDAEVSAQLERIASRVREIKRAEPNLPHRVIAQRVNQEFGTDNRLGRGREALDRRIVDEILKGQANPKTTDRGNYPGGPVSAMRNNIKDTGPENDPERALYDALDRQDRQEQHIAESVAAKEQKDAANLVEQESLPQRLEESVRNTRREGVQREPAVASSNEPAIPEISGANRVAEQRPGTVGEETVREGRDAGETGRNQGRKTGEFVADEAPKAVEAQSAPRPIGSEQAQNGKGAQNPERPGAGPKVSELDKQSVQHAESVLQPKVPGKTQEARSQTALVSSIYRAQETPYDERAKRLIPADREKIVSAIEEAKDGGVSVTHRPASNRDSAEQWTIRGDDGKGYLLSLEGNGRTTWHSLGKPQEAATADADDGKTELRARAAVVSILDDEARDDLAFLLEKKLEKKGTLTAADVPTEFSNKLDTTSWSELRAAIAQNPLAAVEGIRPKSRVTVDTAAIQEAATVPVERPKPEPKGDFEGFTASMTPLQKGQARAALAKDGRAGKIEAAVAAGSSVRVSKLADMPEAKRLRSELERLQKPSRPLDSNDDARIKEIRSALDGIGPQKDVRTLPLTPGSARIYTDEALGKTALDYAEFLIERRDGKAPAEPGGPGPIIDAMLTASRESTMQMANDISDVRYGDPGTILFEYKGVTYSAPEPNDVMPARDTKGVNDAAARAWGAMHVRDGIANPAPKPVQSEPKAEPKPTGSPEREALIDRIVEAAAAGRPKLTIHEIFELKGTDGKWYGTGGMPQGVRMVEPTEKRSKGFGTQNEQGIGVGVIKPTREAQEQRVREMRESNDAEFRKALEEMPEERLKSQAEYWLKEKAPALAPKPAPKGMDGLTREERKAKDAPPKPPALPEAPVHPKSIEKLQKAIADVNVAGLRELLHPLNKRLRAMFTEATGIALPKGVKDTWEFLGNPQTRNDIFAKKTVSDRTFAQKEQQAPKRTAPGWLGTLNEDESHRVTSTMREIQREADAYTEKENKLKPRGNEISVGAGEFDEFIKAYGLGEFLRGLNKGLTPDEAAAKAKVEIDYAVDRHNEKRAKDYNWRRAKGTDFPRIDYALRRVKQALETQAVEAKPEVSRFAEQSKAAEAKVKAAKEALENAKAVQANAKGKRDRDKLQKRIDVLDKEHDDARRAAWEYRDERLKIEGDPAQKLIAGKRYDQVDEKALTPIVRAAVEASPKAKEFTPQQLEAAVKSFASNEWTPFYGSVIDKGLEKAVDNSLDVKLGEIVQKSALDEIEKMTGLEERTGYGQKDRFKYREEVKRSYRAGEIEKILVEARADNKKGLAKKAEDERVAGQQADLERKRVESLKAPLPPEVVKKIQTLTTGEYAALTTEMAADGEGTTATDATMERLRKRGLVEPNKFTFTEEGKKFAAQVQRYDERLKFGVPISERVQSKKMSLTDVTYSDPELIVGKYKDRDFYSDGHFLVEGKMPEKRAGKPVRIKEGFNAPTLFDRPLNPKNGPGEPVHPVAFYEDQKQSRAPGNGEFVVFSNGFTVNGSYLDYVRSLHPNTEMLSAGPDSPLYFKAKDGRIVGVVMGIRGGSAPEGAMAHVPETLGDQVEEPLTKVEKPKEPSFARKPSADDTVYASKETDLPVEGRPFEFTFIHNKEKAPDVGERFGQNIEPAGRYLNAHNPDDIADLHKRAPGRYDTGTLRLENPLVLSFGGGYGENSNWKGALVARFGKTGKALSQAIRDAGYDGVVTISPGPREQDAPYTSEIVDLTSFKAKGKKSEPRDLILQHNLTAANLIHADKMGGLAVPSMAVAKADIPLENFGEITLLGDKALADPNDSGMQVFSGDIYSPRYPRVIYQIKDHKPLYSELKAAHDVVGVGDLADNLKQNGSDALSLDNPAVTWTFLKSKGIEPNVKSDALPQEQTDDLRAAGFDKFFGRTDYYNLRDDPEFVNLAVAYQRKVVEGIQDPLLKREMGGRWTEEQKRNIALHTAYSMSQADSKKVDRSATRDALRDQIKELGLEREFEAFRGEMFDKAGATSKIRLGYTYAGNEKTTAHTLENVVALMKKNMKGGEGFSYGPATVRGAVAPRFRSLSDIRGAKDRLISQADFDKLKDEVNAEFGKVEDMIPGHPPGALVNVMVDAARMGISRALRENGWTATPRAQQAMGEFMEKLKTLPTAYFEAKLPRAVGIDEFKAAVVPNDADPKAVSILEKHGLKIERYDKNDPADRKRAIAAATEGEGMRFNRPNEQTTEEAWQHYDSKDGEKTTLSPTAYRDGGRIVGAPPDVRVVDFMGDVDKSVLTDMAKSRASLAHYVALAERQIQRAVPGFKFGGFTPAGNLHGVNFQGRVFLNDLATHQIALEIVSAERITYPEAYARAMWDVILHEAAHYSEKGHKGPFLAELDRIETEVGPQAIRAIKRDFMRYASEEKHRTQTQKMYEKALPGWREGERRGREAAARAETRSGGLRTSPDVATGLFPRPRGDTRDSEGVRGEGDEPQGSLFAPDGNQAEGLAAPAFVRGSDGRSERVAPGDPRRDENFRRWFGESAAVDTNGDPKVVYHATPDGEITFEADRPAFFTDSPSVANDYTMKRGMWRSEGKASAVYPAFLSIQNPLEIDAFGKRNDNVPVPWQTWSPKVFGNLPKNAVNMRALVDYAKANGHDGVIVKNVVDTADITSKDKSTVYVTLKPTQIKSATGNLGTFDPENPDIRFARKPPAPPAGTTEAKPPTPEELKDPTFWEKVMETRRAFILASWRFLGGNVAGNTISQLSGLAEIPLTAFWDRKMNPGQRRVFAEELNRAVSAIISIGPQASKKLGTDLWDTIKQKENLGSNENEEGKYEQQHRAIGGGKNSSPAEKKLGTAIRTILRMAEITDRFYKTLSWEQSTSRQAYRIARSEGLLGAAASSRADKLMEDFKTTFGSREAALKELRSDKGTHAQRRMLENSHRESRYRTYTLPANAENAGWFGEIAQWIKAAEKWKVVGPIVQSQFLFKNTPANVAFQGFERSPLAWFSVHEKLSALNDLKKKIEAAPDDDTRETLAAGLDKKVESAVDAMARATMGSAIAAIGFGLAAAGLLTGSGPPDPDDREQWMNAGNIPNAIKIGDHWFAFDKLDSMTTALALAANMTQAKNEKDASKMGGAFLNALQSAFIDNSYLNSFGRLSDTISLATKDFGGAISKWLQNVEGSFVPAFVRQTAEYVDPVVRSKRGWIAPIKSGIPGLSKSLPAVRTGTGEPAKRTQRLGESTLGPLSPFGFMRTGDAKGDPLAKEFLAAGYSPDPHRDFISVGVGPVGAKVQHRVALEEKELEVFRNADEQTTKRLREIIKSDGWARLSAEQKKGYFQKVYASMGAKAKEAVMPGVVARLRSTLGARK